MSLSVYTRACRGGLALHDRVGLEIMTEVAGSQESAEAYVIDENYFNWSLKYGKTSRFIRINEKHIVLTCQEN